MTDTTQGGPATDATGGGTGIRSAAYQAHVETPPDVVEYGPDIGTEADFRLLGQLKGKRVVELGCGPAPRSIAVARQGAHAIAVESNEGQVAAARRLCEKSDVRVELHHADLAELAFVRADSVDVVLSVYGLARVTDLDRVFRQAHRVLHQNAPFVFSLPHPVAVAVADNRAYFDRSPTEYWVETTAFTDQPRTVSDLVASLGRANFRVDALLEPEPLPAGHHSPFWNDRHRMIPSTLIIRARKEGI